MRPVLIVSALLVLTACVPRTKPDAVAERINAVRDCVAATPAPANYEIPACSYQPSAATFLPKNGTMGAVWMQQAIESDATIQSVYQGAAAQLEAALSDPTQALALSEQTKVGAAGKGKPAAIIVDVDETILDNDAFNARGLRNRLTTFNEGYFECWGAEKKAKAYPAARDFLNAAAKRGVTVFFVTNRREDQRAPVVETLINEGFPVLDGGANVIFRGFGAGEKDGSKEKGPRRMCVAQQFRVAMLFGDNLGDFVDGVDVSPKQRIDLVKAEQGDTQWGRRWFMLPNPAYGSWVGALAKFRNDDQDPTQFERERERNIETWVDDQLDAPAAEPKTDGSFESKH